MMDTCEKYDATSNLCAASDEANADMFIKNRCDAGTKTIIAILDRIHSKLDKEPSNG